MGLLDDFRKWLNDIPLWQELSKVPDRMDVLEKRMAELEAQLQPAPGKRCEACGQLGLRRTETRVIGPPGIHYTKEWWTCEKCGKKIEVAA